MNRRSRVLAGILAILLLLTALPVTAGAAGDGSFQTSDWIWSSDKVTINSVSYFRKEYTLASRPTKLTIRASAHNHMKYYVNGQLVSGLVTPAPSAPPEAMLYLTYSFTGTELNKLLSILRLLTYYAVVVATELLENIVISRILCVSVVKRRKL